MSTNYILNVSSMISSKPFSLCGFDWTIFLSIATECRFTLGMVLERDGERDVMVSSPLQLRAGL